MRQIIRDSYPQHSRSKKVRHKDRLIERMIKRGYPINFIVGVTGREKEYIEISKICIGGE